MTTKIFYTVTLSNNATNTGDLLQANFDTAVLLIKLHNFEFRRFVNVLLYFKRCCLIHYRNFPSQLTKLTHR